MTSNYHTIDSSDISEYKTTIKSIYAVMKEISVLTNLLDPDKDIHKLIDTRLTLQALMNLTAVARKQTDMLENDVTTRYFELYMTKATKSKNAVEEPPMPEREDPRIAATRKRNMARYKSEQGKRSYE